MDDVGSMWQIDMLLLTFQRFSETVIPGKLFAISERVPRGRRIQINSFSCAVSATAIRPDLPFKMMCRGRPVTPDNYPSRVISSNMQKLSEDVSWREKCVSVSVCVCVCDCVQSPYCNRAVPVLQCGKFDRDWSVHFWCNNCLSAYMLRACVEEHRQFPNSIHHAIWVIMCAVSSVYGNKINLSHHVRAAAWREKWRGNTLQDEFFKVPTTPDFDTRIWEQRWWIFSHSKISPQRSKLQLTMEVF